MALCLHQHTSQHVLLLAPWIQQLDAGEAELPEGLQQMLQALAEHRELDQTEDLRAQAYGLLQRGEVADVTVILDALSVGDVQEGRSDGVRLDTYSQVKNCGSENSSGHHKICIVQSNIPHANKPFMFISVLSLYICRAAMTACWPSLARSRCSDHRQRSQ